MEVAAKELIQFFGSPIGYLFLLAFLGSTLFVFFWGEAFFARNILDVRPMFEWMPVLLIFLSSALTMRMWSEERRSGTLEFLLTLPATTLELVIGKFLACWVLLGIALVLTLPLPLTLAVADNSLAGLDWGTGSCRLCCRDSPGSELYSHWFVYQCQERQSNRRADFGVFGLWVLLFDW
jgi:ABC-2 type transport system permease protein